jgi:hypothetical protein
MTCGHCCTSDARRGLRRRAWGGCGNVGYLTAQSLSLPTDASARVCASHCDDGLDDTL